MFKVRFQYFEMGTQYNIGSVCYSIKEHMLDKEISRFSNDLVTRSKAIDKCT